jgi:hypothetical protein
VYRPQVRHHRQELKLGATTTRFPTDLIPIRFQLSEGVDPVYDESEGMHA